MIFMWWDCWAGPMEWRVDREQPKLGRIDAPGQASVPARGWAEKQLLLDLFKYSTNVLFETHTHYNSCIIKISSLWLSLIIIISAWNIMEFYVPSNHCSSPPLSPFPCLNLEDLAWPWEHNHGWKKDSSFIYLSYDDIHHYNKIRFHSINLQSKPNKNAWIYNMKPNKKIAFINGSSMTPSNIHYREKDQMIFLTVTWQTYTENKKVQINLD